MRQILTHSASTPSPDPFPVEGKGRCVANGRENTLEIILDLPRRKAQNPVSLRGQPFVSPEIAHRHLRQIMHPAVHLDHQTRAMAGEVDDIRADGRLPAETDGKRAETLPELFLGEGRRRAKAATALDAAGFDAFGAGKPVKALPSRGRVGWGGGRVVFGKR